jgi:hypothetical protein
VTDNNENGFDLLDSTLATDDEAVMVVNVGRGAKQTTWLWTFAGPSHPKGIKQQDKLARENIRKTAEQEAARVNGRKYKPERQEPDDVTESNIEFILDRLIGWASTFENGETPQLGDESLVPFSEEKARKLLRHPRMSKVRGEAIEFIVDINSFTRRSVET